MSSTSPRTPDSIDIQSRALLATATAHVTVEALNTRLLPLGLCLPIDPFICGLTMADLVAHNVGGRRQLRYGTIARYLRAATLERVIDNHPPAVIAHPGAVSPQRPITVGGPTLKRATGYGLWRAIVGGQHGFTLLDVTVSLRPLPPDRQRLLFACTDLAGACRLAASLLATGTYLSALAILPADVAVGLPAGACGNLSGAGLLLAEVEGRAEIMARQIEQIAMHANLAGDTLLTQEADWQAWEHVAAQWHSAGALTLSLILPHAALPDYIEQAYVIAQRQGAHILLWGDAGVGTIHLKLRHWDASTPGLASAAQIEAAEQAAALLYMTAQRMGGALCTEGFGNAAYTSWLWQRTAYQHRIASLSWGIAAPTPSPERASQPTTARPRRDVLARLQALVGTAHVLTRPSDLVYYMADASPARASGAPLAVVLPTSSAEVAAVVGLAAEESLPVVTRGAGSGLNGGAVPTDGALLLALTHMRQLRIDTTQRVAHVAAGVLTADVQRAAEACGLFYPPDPASQDIATIGGNIACNAGGPRCLKYGVTADYVLGLTAVLADGRSISVGDRLAAQAPDAGLLHLLIGSEGTLAVITEATLRLITLPASRRTALALFERVEDACATVEAIIAAGVLPATLELLDDTAIAAVESYLPGSLPRDAGALLLLMADGEPEDVAWEMEHLYNLATQGGARRVQVAATPADEASLWQARRSIGPALRRLRPNSLSEDICVPVPQVAAAVRGVKAISTYYDLIIPVFGHAGDGNLHPNILFDARDPAQTTRVWQAAEAICTLAHDLGGAPSGEHGIGMLKLPFLARALGTEILALHHQIKQVFDPYQRLNPGKLLPTEKTKPATAK